MAPAARSLSRSTSRVVKDALVHAASAGAERLAGFLLLPLYTAWLSPEDYGAWALIALATAALETVSGAGVRTTLQRHYGLATSDVERARIVTAGLALEALGAAASVGLALPLAPLVMHALTGTDGFADPLRWAAVGLAARQLAGIAPAIFSARREPRVAGVLRVGQAFGAAGAGAWLVAGEGAGLAGVFAGEALAAAVTGLVGIALLLRLHPPRLDRGTLKRLLAYALPLVPTRILALGAALATDALLRRLLGLAELGLLSVATRFTLPAVVPMIGLQQAFAPFRYEAARAAFGRAHLAAATGACEGAEDARDVERAADARLAAALANETARGELRARVAHTALRFSAACLALWVLGSWFGQLLLVTTTPAEFHRASSLVPALLGASVVSSVASFLSPGYDLGPRLRFLPWATFAAGAAELAATALLVPAFGLTAAPAGRVARSAVLGAVLYRVGRKHLPLAPSWARLATASLVATAALALAPSVTSPTAPETWLALLLALAAASVTLVVGAPAGFLRGNSRRGAAVGRAA